METFQPNSTTMPDMASYQWNHSEKKSCMYSNYMSLDNCELYMVSLTDNFTSCK